MSLPRIEDVVTPSYLVLSSDWAIITATQEAVGPWYAEANLVANAQLEAELYARGASYLRGRGRYEGNDQGPSFLVQDVPLAWRLADKHKQASILTARGLEYLDGRVQRSVGATLFGREAKGAAFYTELENGVVFTVGLEEEAC